MVCNSQNRNMLVLKILFFKIYFCVQKFKVDILVTDVGIIVACMILPVKLKILFAPLLHLYSFSTWPLLGIMPWLPTSKKDGAQFQTKELQGCLQKTPASYNTVLSIHASSKIRSFYLKSPSRRSPLLM